AAAAETEAVADVALDRPAEHAAAADAPGSGHAGATANAPAPAESIVAVALGLAATERAPSLAEEPAALLPQAPRVELALARGALGEGFAAPVSSAVAT
ncbi:type II secretion system protein GspL, partial [Burkholderia pseudomallei CS]|nr:type II secretion system protein GspL [Burkholderia pseudomallei CS]